MLFTDRVLDTVPGHVVYNFLDGFIGYNKICMHIEDQEKMAFVMEWGIFVTAVIMFGVKTVLTTLS